MEQNSDTPRGYIGRGRPVYSDLRRPLPPPPCTYSSDTAYVPTEGGSNGLRTYDEANIQKEPGILPSPSGDHAFSSSSSAMNTPPPSAKEKKSTLSPFAKEFVPRNFHPEPRVPPTQILGDMPINTSSDSYPVQELRHFLHEITLNPGKFERKIQHLIDTLNNMVDDDDTMRAIVNIIFDESVRQPNFRYSGARLCKSLCDELDVSSERLNFRSLLLQRCSQEHKRRDFLAEADDGGTYLRGFAMFLAELYSQLEIANQRIVILAENLTSVIGTLLQYPDTDNVKCICQILKLVGVYLEDYERNKIPNNFTSPEMDKIVASLENVSVNQDITPNIRAMASNVVDLRRSDWGRVVSPAPVIETGNGPNTPPPSLDEPVLYGPDGKPLTPEESLFLHSQCIIHASDADEYDYDDENAYNEMEEEIEEAYELFLREHEMTH